MIKQIKSILNLKKRLKEFPSSTYGGKEALDSADIEVGKMVKKLRFIRVRGRIIPMRRD